MRPLLTVLLLLGLVLPVHAEEFALPKDLVLALPADGSVKVDWLAPPLPEKQVRKAGLSGLRFRLDSSGRVWMGHNRNYISDLATGFAFSLKQPIDDFIFLEDNSLFIVSDKSLGLIAPFSRDKVSVNKIPELPFQPICALPLEQCGLASDGKRIFIYGRDPRTREYAVYELLEDFSSWRKLFVSGMRIFAVAATDEAVYASVGRVVSKIPRRSDEPAKIVFSHPLETVTSLAAVPGSGIFYATSRGVGMISDRGGLEFMKSAQPQAAARNDTLLVFLPDSLAVLQFSETDKLISR